MMKFTVEIPAVPRDVSFSESSLLVSCLPSMHIAMLKVPEEKRYCSIALASSARAFLISLSEGESGRRLSGSSVTDALQSAPSRFRYSAAASRQ